MHRLVDWLLGLLAVHVVVSWEAQRKVRQDWSLEKSLLLLIFTLLVWFASLIAFRIHWLVAGNFRTGELSISALTQHQEQRAPPRVTPQAGT